jgi:hypothetical protein
VILELAVTAALTRGGPPPPTPPPDQSAIQWTVYDDDAARGAAECRRETAAYPRDTCTVKPDTGSWTDMSQPGWIDNFAPPWAPRTRH